MAIIDGHVETMEPQKITNRSNPDAKLRLWNPRYKNGQTAAIGTAPELFNF